MNTLTKRAVVGIVYALVVVLACTQGVWPAIVVFGIFALLCWYEFVQLVQLKDFFYLAAAFVVSAYLYYYFVSGFYNEIPAFLLKAIRFAPPILFILVIITLFFSIDELQTDFAKATISVLFVTMPFALTFVIPDLVYELGERHMTYELLGIFGMIWCSDTFAYFVGRKFGKTKLAAHISPNKTWEGTLGGFIGVLSLAAVLVYFNLLQSQKINWWIVAIIVGIFAPIGDLMESKVKRYFNAKDSGKLLPGHGGFLDRLDSYLAVAPAIYTYLLILYLVQ